MKSASILASDLDAVTRERDVLAAKIEKAQRAAAEKEREECAKVADGYQNKMGHHTIGEAVAQIAIAKAMVPP